MKGEKIKWMKNGLGFLITGILIIAGVKETLMYLVRHSNNAQTGKINVIMAHKVDPEVMVFGSSVGEVGISANTLSEHLNVNVYNASLDGTAAVKSEFLIDELTRYSEKCKYAVIALSAFALRPNDQITEPARFLAHYARPNVRNTIKQEAPEMYRKLYYVPFYSFAVANSVYYKNAAIGFRNVLRSVELHPDRQNGSALHDGEYHNTTKGGEKGTLASSPKVVATYRAVFTKLKKKGITPVAVIMPMHQYGQRFYRDYPDYIGMVRQMCSDSEVELIDFSGNSICADEGYFYNNGHLNSGGAIYLSTMLSDSLKCVMR